MSNYATKKELDHATGVDTSDLAAKRDLATLKAKVEKLRINKLLMFRILWLTPPVDLKKLSDVVDNEVVKNTKINTLKTKVNSLEKEVPDATALIHINYYNTDKQNVNEKIGDVHKKNIRY